MGHDRFSFVGVFVAVGLSLAQARAQDGPAPEAKTSAAAKEFDAWLGTQRDTSGRACNRLAVDDLGDRWVAACGESGLWVARRNPDGAITLVRVDDLGGPVVGLFRREGRVWAEVLRREARDVAAVDENASQAAFPSVDETGRSPQRAAAAIPDSSARALEPPKPPPEGRVTRVLPGEVVVDLGEKEGVAHGDRIQFSVVTRLDVGDESAEQRELLAVGVVKAVSPSFSRVELGIDERVPVGAIARRVDVDPTTKRAAPPRLGSLWHAGFMLRPFIAFDDYGGGFLSEASVGYRFESEIHLEAVLSPFGYGTAENKPSVVPYGAFVKASYDSHIFEVGFGVGAETIKDTPFGTDSGTGILLVQQLRLGAIDGFDVDIQSRAVLFHSRFDFSGLIIRTQIPMGRRFWLLFAGGGGRAGYGYGEAGVRALLRGNGDRGSFFFTGTVGGVGIFENRNEICQEEDFTFPCPDDAQYIGPMIGGGGEWRF
jgi:hypothetical protein